MEKSSTVFQGKRLREGGGRWAAFVAAAAVIAAFSVGCGGGGVNSSVAIPTAEPSATPTAPEPEPSTEVPDAAIGHPIGSVSFVGAPIRGGSVAAAAITLQGVSAGSEVLNLSSSDPGAASVPASVTVPAGTDTVGVPVQAGNVTAPTQVTITATVPSTGNSSSITITVSPPSGLIQAISLGASQVIGGIGTTGTVVLSGPAPGDLQVNLEGSGSASVALPASVIVPAGADRAEFPITTRPVNGPVLVTIAARVGDDPLAATVLTIQPQ